MRIPKITCTALQCVSLNAQFSPKGLGSVLAVLGRNWPTAPGWWLPKGYNLADGCSAVVGIIAAIGVEVACGILSSAVVLWLPCSHRHWANVREWQLSEIAIVLVNQPSWFRWWCCWRIKGSVVNWAQSNLLRYGIRQSILSTGYGGWFEKLERKIEVNDRKEHIQKGGIWNYSFMCCDAAVPDHMAD